MKPFPSRIFCVISDVFIPSSCTGAGSSELPIATLRVRSALEPAVPANPRARNCGSLAVGSKSNRPASSGLTFRERTRCSGPPPLPCAVGPEDREVPLIAVDEPNRLGGALGTGPQHQSERLFRPSGELAAKAFDPAVSCRGSRLRRICPGSVIIHAAAEFHFRSPSALERVGRSVAPGASPEMGLCYATCKRIELRLSSNKMHNKIE